FTIGNQPYMVDRVDLDSLTVHYQYIGVIIPQGEEIFHSAPVDVIRRYIEIDDIKMNLPPEQQTIVEAFETGGFVFNPSHNNEIRFDDAAGYPMTYKTWEDAYTAIDSAELRDFPGLREEVQRILHPEPPLEEPPKPEQPEYATKTVAVYPAEENRMPFEVVIQTIGTNEPKEIPPENFRITDDDLGTGGAKTKFRMNMDAIGTLKQIESENRHATPEEQEILSKYVGWGGLADAFDDSKENWKSEYTELSAALTPEEYTAARSSTLNAHYTSPTVIKAIYEAVGNMGFQTGNILEPAMGVGNFFGLLPEEMSGSKLYGVELDSITGRIAKQLYPNADITVAGFETTDRRDFFDLAVGNVPFGNYKVNDRAYNKLGFSIHDYFFAKTLDQVRPGGVIAFVTSRYTMDKQSPEVRKYIAERADLLGAIRLPNNAFKKNAGTEVTTDILFLQKRDRPQVIEPDWIHLGQTPDGITVNSYFVEHPEMVLGTLKLDDMMYGDKKEVTCEPLPDTSLADLLKEAVKHIGGQYKEAELPDLGDNETIDKTLPADPNVKNYSYTVVDGDVYYRENSIMVQPNLNATAKERVKGMVELRDCVHDLIDKQLYG
ncbi:MAG: N-6 DNA methylase, partial [Clostridia bacterium]|nr:N-6 DNA methylase [Clostridia bacterium]